MSVTNTEILVRDAAEADLPALTVLKPPAALHRDRLQDARETGSRYLVLVRGQAVIGFACLLLKPSAFSADADEEGRYPRIVDLQVAPSERGRGYGSAFLRNIEQQAGSDRIYLSVEPAHNPRAYALYVRLGYQVMQQEPYRSVWEFTDSDGNRHHGEDWVVDMVKPL